MITGMFDNYSYIVYMLIFTLIPIGILWVRYWRFLLLNKKIIIYATIFGIIYQFVSDPFAESWRAWFFSDDKILNIWILNSPIEDLIFIMLVSLAVSSATLVFIRHFSK